MHSQLNLSIPSIFILTFFLISFFLLFPISCSQDDENFEQCFGNFSCGDIKNLTFPFWRDDCPQLCDQAGFRLTRCDDRALLPVINIDGKEFRLLRLNSTNYTMTIAREDLWEQICPSNPINITIGYPFSYSQTNRNLTLFYNCTGPRPPRPVLSPCSNESSYSFYADGLLESRNYQGFSDICGTAIKVQVNQNAFAELEQQNEILLEDWRLGFDVAYDLPALFCQKCNSLQGKCANLSSPQFPIPNCRNPGMHNLLNPTLHQA
ncbi:hypothetical protein DITRI_Ditri04bG0198600 [Diplodiscus trichospermus]